jgi:hypothetical protein
MPGTSSRSSVAKTDRRGDTRGDPSRHSVCDDAQKFAYRHWFHEHVVAAGGNASVSCRIVVMPCHRELDDRIDLA